MSFELARGEYFKWIAHDDYIAPEFAAECLAVAESDPEIEERCLAIARQVTTDQLLATVTPVMSVIGGGTTPGATVASHAITLRSALMDASTLHRILRTADRAVLARISGDVVLLDLRTVDTSQDEFLIQLLLQLSSKDRLG